MPPALENSSRAGFLWAGRRSCNTQRCASFSSCCVIWLEPKIHQTFCPLCKCPCEPQCSEQALHLSGCMEEVDLDMQKCEELPSFLSSWLEGTEATSVPAQSFTAWSAWRTADRRAGSHSVHLPFAREEANIRNKKKKSILASHVSDVSVLLQPGQIHVSAVSEE